MHNRKNLLLSIAIPAYDRLHELKFCLDRFISQIEGRYEEEIEIVISDDCSPDNSLDEIRKIAEQYSFIKYRRYEENIGLEQNLLACADTCTGEYLWLFGDDDYIEPDDGLDKIMGFLRKGNFDFYILNRTRRSFDNTKLISDNWMRLDENKLYEFSGLREFCLAYGFISIIGFISVNIFRRLPFKAVDASHYYGTMYPQLGAMVEAFHHKKTLLIGLPMVCHRTQTSEEKKAALGNKKTELDFMADVDRRNAIYFGHPYIRMLQILIDKKAFEAEDIVKIPENTVINGFLIDFLLGTIKLSRDLVIDVDAQTKSCTKYFFDMLPLDYKRRNKANDLFLDSPEIQSLSYSKLTQMRGNPVLTISAISPSYNQGEFLAECLESVRVQTYTSIEHLVFDPGSTDNSRAIAAQFEHVTLIEEADSGQSDALNKGFSRASGDIIAWLNSDDYFAHPQVFEKVVQRFLEPDSPDIVYGRGFFINEGGDKLRDVYVNDDPSTLHWRLQQEDGILQPALFMRRSVVDRIGPLRNDLHFCMDYEYWIRCVKAGIKFAYIDDDLAVARYHSNNKTYGMRGKSYSEVCDMLLDHFGYVNYNWLKRYAEFLSDGHDGVLAKNIYFNLMEGSDLQSIYRNLLLAYNGPYDTYRLLIDNSSKCKSYVELFKLLLDGVTGNKSKTEIIKRISDNALKDKGYRFTLKEMQSMAISQPVPCKEISLDRKSVPGSATYTVDTRRWAFNSVWRAEQFSKAHNFFRECIAHRKSDTCIIVGNGPSLNKTDLSLLKGHDVIVSNNVYLSDELLEYATYYTVVNYLVAEQSRQHINRLSKVNKVLPYWLSYCLNPGPNTYFVNAIGYPEFSKDIFKNMSWRHTVTFFNFHLAYGLGYKKVIMIGCDHNYKQPKGIVEQEIIQSYEDDDNHFHPDYFRGDKWQAADVGMMEEMYLLAKKAFEEDGREIINSTVGGKLELFPRLSLEEALGVDQTEKTEGASEMQENSPMIGPYSRDLHASYDETDAVANLFSTVLTGNVMIDVGAHQGTALAPFLDYKWKVFAFEPDEKNRAKLQSRLARHKNKALVSVDIRCVSNKSQSGVSFYSSEQSTGISGLSAFHESHVESQQVDTITLSEYFESTPELSVDFLKIDTEGYDLFVLEGFPWERTKPAVIECEFEDSKTVPLGYNFHDLASFLEKKGYTVYVSEWHPVIRYGISHDWNQLVRYPCELSNSNGWGNLIAFRDPVNETSLVAAIRKVLKVKPNNVGTKTAQTNTGLVASIGKWILGQNPTLYFLLKIIRRFLKLLERRTKSAIIFSVYIILLVIAPICIPALTQYLDYFLIAAILQMFILFTALGMWFIRKSILNLIHSTSDEHHAARIALKAELLREINKDK